MHGGIVSVAVARLGRVWLRDRAARPSAGASTGAVGNSSICPTGAPSGLAAFENSYLEIIITKIAQTVWKASSTSESTVPKVWSPETQVLIFYDFLNLRAPRMPCGGAKVLLEDPIDLEDTARGHGCLRCREFCDVTG